MENIEWMTSTTFSQMVTILALNIRQTETEVPLVQPFDSPDHIFDYEVTDGFETSISIWKERSIETQNAFKKVKRFDLIAPAIAWGILRYFYEESRYLEETVWSEIERHSKRGVQVFFPKGCLEFLQRKLTSLETFDCPLVDRRTLLKCTAMYFKNNAPPVFAHDSDIAAQNVSMFRCQLQRFTKVYIWYKMGNWSEVTDLTQGSSRHFECLLDILEEQNEKRWARSLGNLRYFYESYAKPLAINWHTHYVYVSCMSSTFSYMSSENSYNKELFIFLGKLRELIVDNETDDDENVQRIADKYLERTKHLQIESPLPKDFWTGKSTVVVDRTKKRRRRKRR